MHQNGLAVGRPLGAQRGIILAAVEIAIDEIGNDLDGPLDVEFFDGFLLEIVRDAGHAVGLFDGKARDGKKAAIVADQRDVGAVQRGDKRQAARRGHGARQHGADRMRNGVVHVQQVEPRGFGHFQHFHGERKRVGRVIEERIIGDFHFVEGDAVACRQPDRRRIADEMHVMAAGRQFHA